MNSMYTFCYGFGATAEHPSSGNLGVDDHDDDDDGVTYVLITLKLAGPVPTKDMQTPPPLPHLRSCQIFMTDA